jgi:hypothetical protein
MGAYLTHPVGHPMSDADHQPLGIQVGQEGDLQGGEGDIPGAGRRIPMPMTMDLVDARATAAWPSGRNCRPDLKIRRGLARRRTSWLRSPSSGT